MNEHAWDEGVQQEQRAEQAADDPTHYMESTSRLRAENEELQQQLGEMAQAVVKLGATKRLREATMREVAEELRREAKWCDQPSLIRELADRLDPPPVVENPPA